MSGLLASSQANKRSWRLRSELMFHDAMRISEGDQETVISEQLGSWRRLSFGSLITVHNSNSMPGAGTMISDRGSAADKVARIQSTAGGSPRSEERRVGKECRS